MFQHPRFAVPMGPKHVAFYRADFTLSYVRERYEGESGFAFGCVEVSAERLARLESAWRAIPRLSYAPSVPDVSVCLPFGGFYYSLWSDLVDHEESSHCEYEAEREESEEYHPDTFQPEPLRLDAGEFAEISMRHCSYRAAYQAIARDYAESFGDWLAQELAGVLPNFAAPMTFESMRQLFALSESNGHGALRYLIRETFTSYDGFSSHYDNDLESWLEKPLEDWDHNELQTLILAALAIAAPGETGRRIDSEVFDFGDFGSNGHEYYSNAMDWPAYEKAVADLREEKREAAIEAGTLPADDLERPAPRCANTPDLFA